MNLALLLEIVTEAVSERRGGFPAAPSGSPTVNCLSAAGARRHSSLARARITSSASASMRQSFPRRCFGAAVAGRPLVPLNYRLADGVRRALVERVTPAVLVADAPTRDRIGAVDGVASTEAGALGAEAVAAPALNEPDDVAVLRFTSGTKGAPKVAVLRHRNLTSYVLSSVEPFAAAQNEATFISGPANHVAGITGLLSSLYAGRRIVYFPPVQPGGVGRHGAGGIGDARHGRSDDAAPHPRRGGASRRPAPHAAPPRVRWRPHAYLGASGQLVDGWFRTCDAGWLDDAAIFVDGGIDDVIVRGGENLSPGEIEAVLLDHPAVAEAAVVGVPRRLGRGGCGRGCAERCSDRQRRRAAETGREPTSSCRTPNASCSAITRRTTRPESSCDACFAPSSPPRRLGPGDGRTNLEETRPGW